MNPHADHSRSEAVARLYGAHLLTGSSVFDVLLRLARQLEDELLASRQTVEFNVKRADAAEERLRVIEKPWTAQEMLDLVEVIPGVGNFSKPKVRFTEASGMRTHWFEANRAIVYMEMPND